MYKYTFRMAYSELVALSLHKLFNCRNLRSSIVNRKSKIVNK